FRHHYWRLAKGSDRQDGRKHGHQAFRPFSGRRVGAHLFSVAFHVPAGPRDLRGFFLPLWRAWNSRFAREETRFISDCHGLLIENLEPNAFLTGRKYLARIVRGSGANVSRCCRKPPTQFINGKATL